MRPDQSASPDQPNRTCQNDRTCQNNQNVQTCQNDRNGRGIRLLATHIAKPQRRDALLAALKKNVLGSRKEPGNIAFEVYEDTDAPGTFYLVEDWHSMEAIAAHREAPHFKEYMRQAQDFLAERKACFATHIPFED